MLKDGFGRVHDYLRISLLDKCNFRCLYCLPHSPHNKNGFQPKHDAALMSADEIDQFAKAFVNLGVKKIRLTGGEPLVRKDVKDIIIRLSELPVELTLTTNGMYVDEFLQTFQLAGINSVNISLDSLNASTFQKLTGRNEFDRVKSNIQLLLDNNFHVKVNVVVMNGYNETEIPAFIEWTKNSPIHIRFIEFMPFPGNHWQPEKLITYKEILETIKSNFPGVEKLDDGIHDTAKKFRVQNHAGTFAVISTMSEPFCGGCNRMRLTADGKMRNCLFSKTETDLLTSLRAGKEIEPLIKECLFGKHYMLGGHDEKHSAQADLREQADSTGRTSFGGWAEEHAESKERSMLAIGG